MDSTSSAEYTYRRTTEDCNDLQNIAKVSADFLRQANESVHYLHTSRGIFPAQPLHLTNLGGRRGSGVVCHVSGLYEFGMAVFTILEAFGTRYAAGLRSRLDLPIRQMFK
jgi:hypothetical protein